MTADLSHFHVLCSVTHSEKSLLEPFALHQTKVWRKQPKSYRVQHIFFFVSVYTGHTELIVIYTNTSKCFVARVVGIQNWCTGNYVCICEPVLFRLILTHFLRSLFVSVLHKAIYLSYFFFYISNAFSTLALIEFPSSVAICLLLADVSFSLSAEWTDVYVLRVLTTERYRTACLS